MISSDWEWNNKAHLYYIIKKETLPKTKIIKGPPKSIKQHSSEFKKIHKESFEQGKHLYAREKRQYSKNKNSGQSITNMAAKAVANGAIKPRRGPRAWQDLKRKLLFCKEFPPNRRSSPGLPAVGAVADQPDLLYRHKNDPYSRLFLFFGIARLEGRRWLEGWDRPRAQTLGLEPAG